ncbi:MAG: hypothetical protein AB1489_12640, partial [Acidobacteriota bacterium]
HKFILRQPVSDPGLYSGGNIVVSGVSFVIDQINNNTDVELASNVNQPPFQLPVVLNDDDQANEPELVYPRDFALMQDSDIVSENLFASTYIKPKYDLQSTTQPKFNRNIIGAEISTQLFGGRDWFGTKDYWVVYVQGGWQEQEIRDQDPDIDVDHRLVAGITRLTEGSFIFVEAIRDAALLTVNAGYPHINKSLVTKTTVVHEVGHMFNIPDRDAQGGIMEYIELVDPRWQNITSFTFFIPADQKQIRRRVKP